MAFAAHSIIKVRMPKLCTLFFILSALSAAPVAAQSWIDDVVQIDVLDGGTTQSGLQRAALRLTLADGWKTYWRAPGDAGIPPEFSWRGSKNLAHAEVIWPTPRVFDQNGMRSVGYEHELVLPIDVSPQVNGQPIRLKGKVELGVCKDICIPSTVKFDATLSPGAPRHPAIVAARADRPYSAKEAGVSSAKCVVSPTQYGFQVEAHIQMPHAGGEEYTITESGNPNVWASETQVRRSGGTLIATAELMHATSPTFALDRSELRFTVLGSKYAVDVRGCTGG